MRAALQARTDLTVTCTMHFVHPVGWYASLRICTALRHGIVSRHWTHWYSASPCHDQAFDFAKTLKHRLSHTDADREALLLTGTLMLRPAAIQANTRCTNQRQTAIVGMACFNEGWRIPAVPNPPLATQDSKASPVRTRLPP